MKMNASPDVPPKDQQLAAASIPLRTSDPSLVTSGQLTCAEEVQVIQFLYDKRLTLFNVRREHEWKIYFGVMTLLAAIDTALLTGRIRLASWQAWSWSALSFSVSFACFGYLVGLQRRNAADRLAMDTLYNLLFDRANIPAAGFGRERTGTLSTGGLGWSFKWQMIFLIAFALASALLPFTIFGF